MIDLDALAKLPALSVLEIQLIRELGEEREKVAALSEELSISKRQQEDQKKHGQPNRQHPGD